MAIYSLHHQPIGKSTQARPYTSAAHVRYISRPSAASRIEAGRMPDKPGKAAAFLIKGEDTDRINGRVSDKLMLALPRELTAEQRAALVRGFAEEVTQGRAPWLAAFHDQGKDTHNPHAHLVIRDRDPATGKRVAGLSEKGSTERLRILWETHANRALEQARQIERIDHRTLEAQGIARKPTVHEGPKAQQMDARGAEPQSRTRRYRNRVGARRPYRDVDYWRIDRGWSRPAYNRQIGQMESPADYWQAIDADRQRQELDDLRRIHLRHRPDLVDVQLIGRPIKPLQGADKPGAGISTRRLFADAKMDEQILPLSPHRYADANPFDAEPLEGRQTLNSKHSQIYIKKAGGGNNKMADQNENDQKSRWEANDAKKSDLEGKFDYLMDRSYDNKDDAYKRMEIARDKYGSEELSHLLRLEPDKFGDLPKDPVKAVDAPRYRQELAPTFREYGKAHDEGGYLKHTFGERPQSTPAPAGEHKGPTGLSSLWNRGQSELPPSDRASGTPQRITKIGPSSYPLESPFRAEGRQERHPLSQNSPPAGKPTPDAIQRPDASLGKERHPLSIYSPPLPKPLAGQQVPGIPTTTPQQTLAQKPGQEKPALPLGRAKGRGGLDEGR